MSIVSTCGPDVPAKVFARPRSWQQALRDAVRSPDQLCDVLQLPADLRAAARRGATQFPVFAPWEFLARIRPADPTDPLLRQILPVAAEDLAEPGFATDPVGDLPALAAPALLHKYSGRALLVATGACAVHCRYCFRRHYPYHEAASHGTAWQPAIDCLAQSPDIEEIILSGGDPLTLTDERLGLLADRLAAIPHLRRLRIHTRLPVMIPQRVGTPLLDWLCGTRLTPWVVVHINHPQEIDRPVSDSLARLVDRGIPVLNQSVLLRGINDSAEVLADLSRQLVDRRIIPYYLHQLDRVAGAHHFEVPVERGVELVEQLTRQLPGYAVPRYVQERPGEPSKVSLV